MLKVRLIRPDGLVINNRVAKPGDVVDLEPAAAVELLKANAATLIVRIKVTKAHLIDSTFRTVGDIVDVSQECAKRLIESKAAAPAPLKALKTLVADGRSYGAGKTFEGTVNQAIEFITLGLAEYAAEPTPAEAPKR